MFLAYGERQTMQIARIHYLDGQIHCNAERLIHGFTAQIPAPPILMKCIRDLVEQQGWSNQASTLLQPKLPIRLHGSAIWRCQQLDDDARINTDR